ncbi:hypothetical protein DVJ78_18080 (plasmid) [Humibacter sp. BT305]|nr:hypothetical protein DVJ78_18080 [Humibacter sp. BT305]
MAVTFSSSADKHGIDRADALLAIRTRLVHVQKFDDARDGGPRPDLFIGRASDGTMLEVMAVVTPPRDLFIFHLMPLRRKTWDRVKGSRG